MGNHCWVCREFYRSITNKGDREMLNVTVLMGRLVDAPGNWSLH